ncbi:MAG: DUF6449 domain-containing protein [Eubacteriales bacterium]|nr:DUF6449 domain-containing protein [Eubacteriales bacterium]
MIEKLKIKKNENVKENLCQNQFLAILREEFHYNIGTLLFGLLAMFFNYPLNLALRLSNEIDRFNSMGVDYQSFGYTTSHISMAEEKLRYVMENITNGILRGDREAFLMIILVVIAIISARSMFKHLFSKKTTDFYFSQPVSRVKRYMVNYVGGLLIGAICLTVGYIMALLVAAGYHVENIQIYESIKISLGYFVMYALTYTISVVAMIMTGNALAAAGAVLCFFFFFPFVDAIVSGLKAYYLSFYVSEDIGLIYLSPLFIMAEYFDGIASTKEIPLALVRNAGIATVILALTGGFLYRIRPAESCGRAVAFQALKRPIRMLLSITAGIGAMTWVGMLYNDNFIWTVIFVVLGAVITHAILEIIINSDVRALFNNKIEKLVCILAAFSVIMIFKYDAFGYDSYLPDESAVEAVSMDIPYNAFEERWEQKRAVYEYEHLDSRYSDVYWTDYPDVIEDGLIYSEQAIGAVLNIGKKAIEENNTNKTNELEDSIAVRVCFHLKNGDKIDRRYVLSNEAMSGEMEILFSDKEFKTVMYPILTEEPEEMGSFGIELASVSENEQAEKNIVEKSGEANIALPVYPKTQSNQVIGLSFDKNLEMELLDALKKDIMNMKYSDYEDWWDENGYLKKDILYYVTDEAMKINEYNGEDSELMVNHADEYPIFDSFTNVKSVLEKYEIK